MRYFPLVAVWCSIPILNGCSPTFNWRDVRPDQTPLAALFPCKPDQEARAVSLGTKNVSMTMLRCDAGGVTFTLAYADTKDAASTGSFLAQWKVATLNNLRAQPSSELPFVLKGASLLPLSVKVEALGIRQNGTSVAVQAVWFAVGSLIVQATVYADTADPAVAETFFAGLKLQ